ADPGGRSYPLRRLDRARRSGLRGPGGTRRRLCRDHSPQERADEYVARWPRGLVGVLVDLDDFSGALDLGVGVNRLKPGFAARPEGLERLRLAGLRPQEHGPLVGRARG